MNLKFRINSSCFLFSGCYVIFFCCHFKAIEKWNNRLVEEEFGWEDEWGVGVGVGEGDVECQVRGRFLRCLFYGMFSDLRLFFMIKI